MKTATQIIQDLEQSVIDIDTHLADSNFGNFTVAGNNARALLGNAIGQLNAHGAELAKKPTPKPALPSLPPTPTVNVSSPAR